MIILLLFLQKQNLAFAVYQFGSVLSSYKGLKRGVLRAFWDLKTENGVFFGQKSFLTQFSLFSLEFLKRH